MDQLPAYSESSAGASTSRPANARSEYTVSLETSKGEKWLTLRARSRAQDSSSLPSFLEGDVISGNVDMEVAKSESIKAITVMVAAGTTYVGQEEERFLKVEKELWTPSMPLPDGSKVSKFSKGHYHWSFELALPKEVEVEDGKVKKPFPLPPIFTERASPVYLDYKLIVTVKRGMLKVNQTLQTAISYLPVTRPEPPSPMRQKAYKENLRLIGPDGDPEGWHVCAPVTVSGTVFESRKVEVSCTLALAKPLTYARGTPLPLIMTLSGDDEHALDLLASPSSIHLTMVRSVMTGPKATDDSVEAGEFEAGAVDRILQGEIDVKRSLKPSFHFPNFTTRVS
ncbi:hypothetical protein CONPUDRAFT_51562 [Coniophora puteana RWD-64-598 SS2]|uniref:Arrestin-like N-terminal domain-containing protein n=1 Tax=Coniophora puteana (strain RWD-64-598) TaxID=741705 RepID=A0A5M3MZ77_CONPW|nr:uncharacterized protein CONPUDRAFT_51562 [Coniophora puteana RWD-64-598 SS2]EIW83921.1 hypothetical protein CONPUDRAFT_51562 [Coniophora puteana RWD-64-598 SS2]